MSHQSFPESLCLPILQPWSRHWLEANFLSQDTPNCQGNYFCSCTQRLDPKVCLSCTGFGVAEVEKMEGKF